MQSIANAAADPPRQARMEIILLNERKEAEDASVTQLIPSFMTACISHTDEVQGKLHHPVENPYGAEPFIAGSMVGKVVLLRRGKCTFDSKVRAVDAAGGAVALIVVDSGDGASINVNIRNTAGGEHAPSLVLVGVTKAAGEKLIEQVGRTVCMRPSCSLMGGALNGRGAAMAGESGSQRDALGRNFLMAAAAVDNVEMVRHGLAAVGVDLMAVDDDGDTALHHAARNGATRCAALLLKGCEPNSSVAVFNREGYSALGLAAEYGRTTFVQLLLSAGADANDGGGEGGLSRTTSGQVVSRPLHHAASRGFAETARALLRGGADTTTLDGKGESALGVAVGGARELLTDPLADALKELVCGRIDMDSVRPAIEQAICADLGDDVEVVEVRSNSNEALGAAFVAAAQHMSADGVDPMVRLLWHGCGSGVLSTLLRDGFKTSWSSLEFNVYGVGVYFAVDARLSTFFLTTNPKTGEVTAPDTDGCYVLILAATLMGRTGVRDPLLGGSESEKATMEVALKHPANRNAPVGCHSATGTKLKELVLYENSHAFPAFTVRFRLPKDAAPLPDPYDEDERTEHTYLRALQHAPHGILPGWRDVRGRKAELDKGGEAGLTQLVYDVQLVGGWDPRLAAEEQDEAAALMSKVARLEQRNADMERQLENEKLARRAAEEESERLRGVLSAL